MKTKIDSITFVDWKDTEYLKKFINPHARILSARKTGASRKMTRTIAEAIKRARFMGLLPFISR